VKYPDELRAEVVHAVTEGQMTYAGAARRYGMVGETVKNWVEAARQNPDGSPWAQHATNRERIEALERRLVELEHDDARVERVAVAAVRGLVDAVMPGVVLVGHGDDQSAISDLSESARHEA
jgi:transposase-like protein